jgi:hypothetical protein
MQTFTPEFQAELDKGRTDPFVLVDGYEFYSPDYIPDPIVGFDPADAIERFAGQELTWNGHAYRREVVSRGDIVLNIGEKTNSVSITFSNITRYMATFAQSQTIEGMLLCIRCIAPAVTNDSKAMFHGRCDKPGDIDKKSFPLTARQDFGNLNQTAPPRKFTADDPNGRLFGDDLFEGFPFFTVPGSYAFPFVRQSNGFLGRVFGRRTTDRGTTQFSSVDGTPYGSPVAEVFGRCQMPLTAIASVDKGVHIPALWVACAGPIAAITNIKTQQEELTDPINSFENPPDPAIVHLGDAGGTGTNQGNTGQTDLGGGLKFSYTAYVEGSITLKRVLQDQSLSDPDLINELPLVTALILGRIVALPDGSGDYVLEGWTDNPVHIARFILTHPQFVNIDPGFMEDEVNYLTALHCDEPILEESDSQLIAISSPDILRAGTDFTRYRPTGLITPRSILFDLGDDSIIPELEDGPYLPVPPDGGPDDVLCPIGFHHDPDTGTCVADVPGTVINATQGLLRKRYTASFPITEEIRTVDLLHKIILPAFRGFLKVSGKGRLGLHSERPSSATRLRSATAVGATSIPVLDVTPWKTGELLQGRIVISGGQVHSETRTVTSADYSTSGNSITLTATDTGGVTATASGATLSGGSTTVQASGTVTLTGTPDGTVIITIDGVSVAYILSGTDTLETAAGMLTAHINATRRLRQYIFAEWSGAVITIKCLHGALNVPALLKAHDGPIANPTTAPTVAAAASGSLQAGIYQIASADVNANGLTALTLLATVTLLADQKINVSSLPAFPAGVTSRQFFVSEKPGSTRLRYQATRTDASDFSINALPLPNAALAPSQNTTAEELIRVAMSLATNSQDVFPARRPSTAVVLNDIYLPDPLNGHKYQATSITTGITGSTTPTWPTSVGGTVVDGGVTWTEIGSTVLAQAGLTRANILKDTYHWPLGSMQASVNVVEIPFRDSTNDFALTTLRIHDAAHQAQVKKKYPLKIDGSAIDNYNQAFRIGSGELSKNREGDWFNAGETGPAGLVLEEGDLIASSDDSGGHINVITRIEELRIKPNHTVAITKARKYSTAMFSDDVGSHTIPIASTLRYVATLDSLAEFIDTPAIREADRGKSGFFIAGSRDLDEDGDHRGFTVHVDYGDGYVQVAQGDVHATIGESTDTLAAVSDITVLDETNDIGVAFDYVAASAPFTSCTEADLLANPLKHLFLINGEYIQAATIVDNGNRSFTLSDILHGRFETECVAHSSGERVVYIDGAEVFVPTDPSRIGIEYPYKIVTTNQDVADATAIPFTWLGNIFKPAKVTDVVCALDGSGDWLTQFDMHPFPGITPLGRVEVWTDETRTDPLDLKRTLPVTKGTSHAVMWFVEGETYTEDPDVIDTLETSHADKNNVYSSILGSSNAVALETLDSSFTYVSFSIRWRGASSDATEQAAFFHTVKVGLQPMASADPDDVDFALCPISVEWELGTIPGTVKEIYKSFGVMVAERDNVDPGFYLSDSSERSGPRYTFLLSGTEYRITVNSSPNSGEPPIVIVANAGSFPAALRLVATLNSDNESVGVENAIAGGALKYSTVYAGREQEEDFGSLQTRIYLRIYEQGPHGIQGIPFDVVAPPL